MLYLWWLEWPITSIHSNACPYISPSSKRGIYLLCVVIVQQCMLEKLDKHSKQE